MHNNQIVAVAVPCFNEELMIKQTIDDIPQFVDIVLVVNDASTDDTANVVLKIAQTDSRVRLLSLEQNQGVGGALISGYQHLMDKTDAAYIGVVAGDAQFDSSYLTEMIEELDERGVDYVKASRFYHREAFKQMPKYRQFGNIFISLLTKFSTGYYSVTDITNGCGFFKRSILERVDFSIVKRRYDYETSMLTALSIANAKVIDHAVPAHYGDEKSTIKLVPTALRNLRAIWVGFWRRITRKYVIEGFHPIALFLFGGLGLSALGIIGGLTLVVVRIIDGSSPTSGSVMLVVLPIVLGFQMCLTALTMDVANEKR